LDIRNTISTIIILALAYGAMIFTASQLSKIFKLKIFIPKDNVDDHLKNMPSYLK